MKKDQSQETPRHSFRLAGDDMRRLDLIADYLSKRDGAQSNRSEALREALADYCERHKID